MNFESLFETAQKYGLLIHQVRAAVQYLRKFGYLTRGDYADAVAAFQEIADIVVDGELGVKTYLEMQRPRCGCPDFIDPEQESHAEYLQMIEFARTKWTKDGLKYAVHQFIPGVPESSQGQIFQQAFDAWTDVCGLSQVERVSSTSQADIVLSIGQGRRHQFDGPGGTLAWAYLPQGDNRQLLCRFDIDERWAIGSRDRGTKLLNVATHEFGHLLGLDHSQQQTALMAPYYNPSVATPQQVDDVPRIQANYGPPIVVVPEPDDPEPKPDPSGVTTIVIEGDVKHIRIPGYMIYKNPT